MKPINLKIKGINSYVTEQEIDFKRLAESNVFGIFGETGSGKTTILDSIILALYGVSDRDNLQNIINVNTKDAYVEFIFEMENSSGSVNKYYVRRDFKLRNSGLKTEAVLNDLRKKKTIAEMPDNVNQKILDIIGVGKKEFTKCIALPQGEFDRFLSDTPAVRKKTLAKLFDLEQFGILLNEKLKKRKDITSLDKSTLEEKISIYNGINKETIDKIEKTLKVSDHELNKTSRQLSKDKKLSESIKKELEDKQNLLDLEVNLSIKQSELPEINLIEKQIDYTEKYGDYSILNTKYENAINELDTLQMSVNDNKSALLGYNEEIKKIQILLNDNNQTLHNIESQINNIKINEEKAKLHKEQYESLLAEKEKINQKLMESSARTAETTTILKNYKATILDLKNNYEKIQKLIFDNTITIDKLSNCQTFKTKQDFALFLTIARSKINPDDLIEVENFNIYDQVTTVVHDMENFELGVRKEVSEIIKDLKNLDIDYNNLDEIRDDFFKQNEMLNKKCDEIERQVTIAKENLATAKATIDLSQKQVAEYNEALETIKKKIQEEKQNVQDIQPNKDYDYLCKTLEKHTEISASLNDKLKDLNTKKQKTIIDIEVATNNIENYKEKLSQLSTSLKPYSKTTFKQRVDNSMLLNQDEIPALKEKVENYRTELAVLEANTKTLRDKTKDYVYTKDDYNSLLENITANEEKLTELRVFINVNKITIDIQKQNLETVTHLQSDLEKVNREYLAIEKLESLLSNGALIDFVAEEYMGLITDFANTYVYRISKGKYLLNYDGDFNVIDNFNGGIKRSVKTLSGGERFIVSLSLALGISQSIAVNNNKNFNFFFIDEGFGNLSENYIEKVLQSFDALIKLNFTVGFITHVEKMQYYLNSRIVVTKDNTEDGSKIKEYY